MKLCYRDNDGRARQDSLTREEEQAIAYRGPRFVRHRTLNLINDLWLSPHGELYKHPNRRLANSLVWIWFQMNRGVILKNIRIAMALRGVSSINALANNMEMNASFISRLFNPNKPENWGGWNVENVFKIASALDCEPTSLLCSDLETAVLKELTRRGW